jgi:hypothetical protein
VFDLVGEEINDVLGDSARLVIGALDSAYGEDELRLDERDDF